MLPCRWTPSQYNGLVASLGRLLRVSSSDIHCQLEDPHNTFSFWLFAKRAHRTHWHTNCFDLLELKDGLKKGKFSIWMFQVSFLYAFVDPTSLWYLLSTVHTDIQLVRRWSAACQTVKRIWTSPLITLFDQLHILLGLQTP